MKRGFTLIELLAVIVILAIIALIATPIVINIIEDARISSKQRSVDMFEKNVALAITKQYQKNPQLNLDGRYKTLDGKTLINVEDNTKTITIDYDGDIVLCDIIIINKSGAVSANACVVGNDTNTIINPIEDLVPTPEQIANVSQIVNNTSSNTNEYYFIEEYTDSEDEKNTLAYIQSLEDEKIHEVVAQIHGYYFFWFCNRKSASLQSEELEPFMWYVFDWSQLKLIPFNNAFQITTETFDSNYIKDYNYLERVVNSFNN